jgi:hypothetical protein
MEKLLMNLKKEIFPIGLVLILILSRLIPHPPNFTPIVAVAIMSGYLFKNIYLSFATLLVSMLVADAFIGFYENIFFVYLSLLFLVYIFYKLGRKINLKNLFLYSFTGSILFFIITNFGVWSLGSPGLDNVPYEKNLQGLIKCYILAIPFIKNTVLSTLTFSYSILLVNTLKNKISI